MNLQYRVELMVRLGEYMLYNETAWTAEKEKASQGNGWFIPEFVDLATRQIGTHFLQKKKLEEWVSHYQISSINKDSKTVGIVMAGNIPLVGFHDFLCVFISGHRAAIKASSKDEVLIKHLVKKLIEWEPALENQLVFAGMLKGADAYIATGSNNTSRYFDFYFGKYPHIIRKNRTSIAVLDGKESQGDLEKLADDVYQYFGLGCRNVTKLWVPEGFNFVPLLEAFRKYNYFSEHHKYKNNFDYNLAILLLNKLYYMTNGSLLLVEDTALFSPISQLNYQFYKNQVNLNSKMEPTGSLQCIVGKNFATFGKAQEPELEDYADGINTLNFLLRL